MPGPARITIELEPPARHRPRWLARTRVEEADRPLDPAPVGESVVVPVQREPAVVPAGYEPPVDCTCLDGFCDVDHANE